MTDKMDRYVKALSGGSMIPPNLLRENVSRMRSLEESFRNDLRGMLVALGRKDMRLVEKAINQMDETMNKARTLLDDMKEKVDEATGDQK